MLRLQLSPLVRSLLNYACSLQICCPCSHCLTKAAARGYHGVERAHTSLSFFKVCVLPVQQPLLLAIPAQSVQHAHITMPVWLNHEYGCRWWHGIVAVGYAMVINMMATREVWPFFAIGFALAAISPIDSYRSWCNRCRYRLRLPQPSKQRWREWWPELISSGDPIGDILEGRY